MDHATVQTWLDRYIDAWRTYDEQAIGDLFSEDATYRYHRWDNTQPVPRNPYSNDPGTAIRNDLHVRDW